MADYKNGEYIVDLSTFYPVRYGLYGAMTKSEGLMPSEMSNYDEGEDGDEDMTEYEDEAGEVGGVEDLPKFRTLVKNKKLELKNQYGKGYYVVTKRFKKKATCVEALTDCEYREVGDRVGKITANLHPNKTKWVSGWRKKWREFKQAGGLAQLKLQARGVIPIPTAPSITPPPPPPAASTPPPAASTPFLQNIKPVTIVKSRQRPRPTTITKGQMADDTSTQRGMTTGKEKIITYVVIGVVAIAAIWLIMKTVAKKAA